MASTTDVMDTMADQIGLAIQNAGIPLKGFVGVGWPNMPDLTKQMEQVPAQYYVSVYPLPTQRNTTRFFQQMWDLTIVTPAISASTVGNAITLGGQPGIGVNVTVTFNRLYMTTYQPTTSDTLASTALGLANAINSLGVSGVTASVSGVTVAVSGVFDLNCNIGTTVQQAWEAIRTEQHFQVSVFAPDAPTRNSISEAIKTWFATVYFLQFPDTSFGRIRFVTMPWSDEMQLDTLYTAKIIYCVEYATLATDVATTITAVQTTVNSPNQTITDAEP